MYCSHHVPLEYGCFLLNNKLFYPTHKLGNMITFVHIFWKKGILLYLDTCACQLSTNFCNVLKFKKLYQQIFCILKNTWQITNG
jgi:hypothetical protein